MTPAEHLIQDAMLDRAPRDRAAFLREALAHAAGLLATIESDEHAALIMYRLGDQLVAASPSEIDR